MLISILITNTAFAKITRRITSFEFHHIKYAVGLVLIFPVIIGLLQLFIWFFYFFIIDLRFAGALLFLLLHSAILIAFELGSLY